MKTQVYNLKTNPYKLRISRNLLLPWAVILMALFNATDVCAQPFSGGDGSEADPYLISSVADLQAWALASATPANGGTDATYEGMHFKLTDDIDLAGLNWSSPIRNFKGYLHGNGKAIKNLTINTPDASYKGLFTAIYGCVEKLELLDVNISAISISGALASSMYAGAIVSEIYATGTVTGTTDRLGGLVGILYGGLITNSVARVDVTGVMALGGVVGRQQGTSSITKCYATGSVLWDGSTSGDYYGAYIGGIVGGQWSGNPAISQYCVPINPTIKATGTWGYGRVRGRGEGGTNTSSDNLCWDGTIFDAPNTTQGGTLRTLEELKMDTTYAAITWDISTSLDPTKVWYINNGESFPVFQWQVPVISITTQPASADVTKGDISGSLSVAAEATRNEVTWSYQWYVNTEASNTGGTPIENATEATFAIPEDLEPGEYYYYVEVGATDDRTGVAATTAASEAATVTVGQLTGILSPRSTGDDPVIATRYYTLQGTEIVRPSETAPYIVRNQLKSGKETASKVFINKNR